MTRRKRRKGRRELQQGRPTLLTEDVYQELLELVEGGNTLSTAAQSLGLKPNTVQGWYRKGCESTREPYYTFAKDVDTAEAKYRASRVRVVNDLAPESPALAKWQLEKAEPERYGQTREERPEVALPAAQQQTTVIVLTPDEIRAMARREIAEERGDFDGDGSTGSSDRLKRLGTDISGTRTD